MTITKDEAKALLVGATEGPYQVAGTRHSGDLKIGPSTRLHFIGPDDDALAAVFFDMKTGRGLKDAHLLAAAPDLARAFIASEEAREALEERVRVLEEALTSVLDACDQGRMIPKPGSSIGGMTIDANIRGSVYIGVPAWPIEEARAALTESQP